MAQYQPGPMQPPAQDPNRTLSIVGLILAILPCTYFIGLIISIIAFVKSRGIGMKNNLALAGIIIGGVYIVISIILNATGTLTQMMQSY